MAPVRRVRYLSGEPAAPGAPERRLYRALWEAVWFDGGKYPGKVMDFSREQESRRTLPRLYRPLAEAPDKEGIEVTLAGMAAVVLAVAPLANIIYNPFFFGNGVWVQLLTLLVVLAVVVMPCILYSRSRDLLARQMTSRSRVSRVIRIPLEGSDD